MKTCPSKILVAIVVVIAALLTAAPQQVSAHTKSISYSSWVLGDAGASVRVRISLLELSRLGYVVNGEADGAKISSYLGERLLMLSQGGVCDATGAPMQITAPEGWVHFEWRVDCRDVEDISIQSSIMLDAAPGHLHFARVRAEGMPTVERVLSAREQSFSIDRADEGGSAQGTSIAGYLEIGVEHILSGWDHLAFVLALLLLAIFKFNLQWMLIVAVALALNIANFYGYWLSSSAANRKWKGGDVESGGAAAQPAMDASSVYTQAVGKAIAGSLVQQATSGFSKFMGGGGSSQEADL